MAHDTRPGFLATLRGELHAKGVREGEVADWLHTSVSTVSRRLTGISDFSRDEVVILDERLGDHGGLLALAGFVPDHTDLPRSRYFDEQAFAERFDEAILLSQHQSTPLPVIERCIRRLLRYLGSVQQCQAVRRFQLRLECELLDHQSNRAGVTATILHAAQDVRCRADAVGDRLVSYNCEGLLSDLYVGVGDTRRALVHQQKAYEIIRTVPDQDAEILDTEVAIARLLAAINPADPLVGRIIEKAERTLWVPGYEPWQWPRAGEGPSYLDVLYAKLEVQTAQGDMRGAGDTVTLILDRFMTSPLVSDTIASLLCAAGFAARDHQPAAMERYLAKAESLIDRFEQHWFGNEPELIRALLQDCESAPG